MLHVSKRFYSFGKIIVSRNMKQRLNEKINERKYKKLVDDFFEKYDNNKKIRKALKDGNEELENYKKK